MTATISPLTRAATTTRKQDNDPKRYIAIVDDDDSVRRALARLITAYSFHVQTYGSGSEFLDSLQLARPDCLIVDLQMDDMTGLELLHRLTDMGLNIPAIVVTARDEPGIQHRCKLRGAVAVLVKPVMIEPLLRAIETATCGAGSGTATQAHP